MPALALGVALLFVPGPASMEDADGIGDRGSIEVRVTDEVTRSAAAGREVRIQCACLDSPRVGTTDETGVIRFEALPDGEYSVEDRLGEAAPATVEVAASEDARARVELRARALARAPERFAAGTLVWSGVGVVAIGATVLAGGVLASTLDPCNGDGANPLACGKDLRAQWSIALATVGAASVGAGVAMIAVGKRRRVALGPTLSLRRGGGSVGLRARF